MILQLAIEDRDARALVCALRSLARQLMPGRRQEVVSDLAAGLEAHLPPEQEAQEL
uniref:Uncharacterized protein n=1 Tax=viral metagenome TaxID=1070528 RepID=A0A6H2A5R5_9ZZZZ